MEGLLPVSQGLWWRMPVEPFLLLWRAVKVTTVIADAASNWQEGIWCFNWGKRYE